MPLNVTNRSLVSLFEVMVLYSYLLSLLRVRKMLNVPAEWLYNAHCACWMAVQCSLCLLSGCTMLTVLSECVHTGTPALQLSTGQVRMSGGGRVACLAAYGSTCCLVGGGGTGGGGGAPQIPRTHIPCLCFPHAGSLALSLTLTGWLLISAGTSNDIRVAPVNQSV